MYSGLHQHTMGQSSMALTSGKPTVGTVASTCSSAASTTSDWRNNMVEEIKRRCEKAGQVGPDDTKYPDALAKVEMVSDDSCKSSSSRQHAVASTATSVPHSGKVRLQDFEIGRMLGTGSFGRVFLARHKQKNQVFAIKSLSKAACIKDGQVKHVVDERAMLMQVQHPFVVPLRATFQDAECLYLVLDFINGGEFFTLLRDLPRTEGVPTRMKEDHARFYTSQIVLALEHLHSKNIAYRDLKPENLLLGSDGYLRMTDFGFAKVVMDKTYTMCGTPDYLAPEVVVSKGHTPAVDWWSLGCVIYEMLHGFPPFYTGDPVKTYKKILDGQLVFPSSFSGMVKDLITGLLQTDPAKRYGVAGKGAADLKLHPWFRGLDWGYVMGKRYQPPHPRKVASQDDTSNFDDYSAVPSLRHPFVLTPEQQQLFASF